MMEWYEILIIVLFIASLPFALKGCGPEDHWAQVDMTKVVSSPEQLREEGYTEEEVEWIIESDKDYCGESYPY